MKQDWSVVYFLKDDAVPLSFCCDTASEGETWLREGIVRRPGSCGFVVPRRPLPAWPEFNVIPFKQEA